MLAALGLGTRAALTGGARTFVVLALCAALYPICASKDLDALKYVSNLGSAANALLSVVIILLFDYQLVFVVSVLPFVADFAMVATYPSYMNETPGTKQSFTAIMGDTCGALAVLLHDGRKRRPLLASACFQAVFTTLKHYIQVRVRAAACA